MKLKKSTLILGIGNYLMGDEGIGVHVANVLEKYNPFDGVAILDGGTGGFHLLEYFEKYEHVILVDATLDGNVPGTIRQIKPRFAKDFPPAMSTHDIGLKDMICAMQILGSIPEIDLFVVSIASIQQQGLELTPSLAAVVPDIIEKIGGLLQIGFKRQVQYMI